MNTLTPSQRNKGPILEVLKQYLQKGRLLEIGTGCAEHAIFFAKNFPEIQWVTSDRLDWHREISQTLKKAQIKNLHGPELLEIGQNDFPKGGFNYLYSSNTLHIMSWKENKTFFKLLSKRLREGALVFFYGPFNYNGKFTSPSNESFDQHLKLRNEKSGIRNFEDIVSQMKKGGFEIIDDHEMPANNRTLVFQRLAYEKTQV